VKLSGSSGLALVFVLMLVSLLACTPGEDMLGGRESVALEIECQVFYRPSVGQSPGDGTVIDLVGHGDRGTSEYTDMVFDAQFNDDPGEGPSLVISVTAKDSGDQILRQLYQIDRAKGLQNQFIGGHGFTGLVYVYHPASSAELQYFCGVDSQ
jgi:hypothetical protein